MRLRLLPILLLPFLLHAQQPVYNPYTSWGFKYKDEGMNSVFITDTFTIVVENRDFNGSGRGSFVVAGPGPAEGSANLGSADMKFKWKYFNSVTKCSFCGSNFEIVDNGRSLKIGDKSYPLTDEPLSFELSKTGEFHLKGEDKDP